MYKSLLPIISIITFTIGSVCAEEQSDWLLPGKIVTQEIIQDGKVDLEKIKSLLNQQMPLLPESQQKQIQDALKTDPKNLQINISTKQENSKHINLLISPENNGKIVFDSQNSVPQNVEWAEDQEMTITRDLPTKLFLYEILVNGKPCRMVIDTGATHTILDQAWVEKNFPNDKKYPDSRVGSNFQLYQIKQLCFGENKFNHFLSLIGDLSQLNTTFGKKIDGILGMNVMGQKKFILDEKKGKFTFVSDDFLTQKKIIPLKTQFSPTGLLTVEVERDGLTFPMMLDSGCSETRISEEWWPKDEEASFLAKTTNIHTNKDNAESVMHFRGKKQSLKLTETITLEPMTPILFPKDAYPYGLFGSDFFGQYALVFDFINRQVGIVQERVEKNRISEDEMAKMAEEEGFTQNKKEMILWLVIGSLAVIILAMGMGLFLCRKPK